jgi:hypothetical protein
MSLIQTIFIMRLYIVFGLYLFVTFQAFGQVIDNDTYDSIGKSNNGFTTGLFDGKYFLIDSLGNQLTASVYNRIQLHTLNKGCEITVVEKNGKFGYLNNKGVEIIKCKYDCALDFSEGLAAVKENDKWGFINDKGEYVIRNIYDSETANFAFGEDVLFSKGVARVLLNGNAIFIDSKGKKIQDCIYERIEPFHAGLAAVKLNEKWGFIDSTLRQIIPCIYDGTPMFPGFSDHYPNIAPVFTETGLCVVAGEFRTFYTIIDKTGKQIIPWTTDLIVIPNNDKYLSSLQINGKYGFINYLGQIEIPPIYDDIIFDNEFSSIYLLSDYEPLAIRIKDKYGFINIKGDVVVPLIYDKAEYFVDGKAKVRINGEEFYINKYGHRIN